MKVGILSLVSCVAWTALASAQSFNIDLGAPGSTPSSSYGAAGLPGFWNSVQPAHSTPSFGPQPFDIPLTDIDGNATSVGLHQYGGTQYIDTPDASVSGDDAALLHDALVTHSIPLKTCLYLNGLENGTYEVLSYAWMPNHPRVMNRVFIDFTPGDFLVGGTWPGLHVEGISVARHIVTVTNGFMGPHAGLPDFGDPVIGGALNGIQLRKLPCAECTTELCLGDGSGTACPCGNTGAAGRGCGSSSVSSGARLFVSATADPLRSMLTCTNLPAGAWCVFFSSAGTAGGGGAVFGDGLRCFAGKRQRFGGQFELAGTASVESLTPWAGSPRLFQALYRDPNAAFCNPSAWNTSNAVRIAQ